MLKRNFPTASNGIFQDASASAVSLLLMMVVVAVVSDCLGNTIRDQTGGRLAGETLDPGVGNEEPLKTC